MLFPPSFRLPSRKTAHGLTLIESVIYLGVVGLVFGAIWAAASSVTFNRQIGGTLGDMMQITQNVRSLYKNQSAFSGNSGWGTGSNITEAMVNAEVVPAEMIDTDNLTTLRSPWQTPVQIQVGPTLREFQIAYQDTLPQEVCMALTMRTIGAGRDQGLTEVIVNGSSFSGNSLADMKASSINSGCSHVTFVFNLKG